MPTLVFDVRANHDTGVSRFGLNTLAAAAPLLARADWKVIVVAHPHQADRARTAVSGTSATVLCGPEDEVGFVRQSPWLRDLLVSTDADLYFTAHYTVDRHCPVPYVFTIHDLTRLQFPELSYTDATFAKRYGSAELSLIGDELRDLGDRAPVNGGGTFARYFRALTHDLAARAEQVVTVSRTTARDIQTVLNVDPRRLALVPCTVNTCVFHRRSDDVVRAVRRKYRLSGPYLLFIGLVHPNKRIGWLVRQLLEGRDRFPADTRLVAVGGYAEQVPDVAEELARHNARDFVAFTGRVSDADLAALYSGASALVTASVSEGSNLPPQEAMACGCQVIATDIPTHRETLQDAAALYPPERGDELVRLAAQALRGTLPDRASRYRPPGRPQIGQSLFEALAQAVGR